MTRRILTLIGLVGLLSGGFILLDEIDARAHPGEVIEKQVSANMMQVRVNGRWEELPLMPLAEQACQSGDSHFERYCD